MNAPTVKEGSPTQHLPSSDQSQTGLTGQPDVAFTRDQDRFAKALAGRSDKAGATTEEALCPGSQLSDRNNTGPFDKARASTEKALWPLGQLSDRNNTGPFDKARAATEKSHRPVGQLSDQNNTGSFDKAGTPALERTKTRWPDTLGVLTDRDKRLPSGDSILASMHDGRPDQLQPAGGPNNAAAFQVESAPRPGQNLVSQLAERILVSASDALGGREVRITLREDVLPGTEIRIQRQEGGSLSVSFVTNDLQAEQMLGSGSLKDLQNTLVDKLQVEVKVYTVRTDGGLTAESGSRQTGGGRNGNQDEQRDGRSRQHDIFTGLSDDG
jgi:hypothetical protein